MTDTDLRHELEAERMRSQLLSEELGAICSELGLSIDESDRAASVVKALVAGLADKVYYHYKTGNLYCEFMRVKAVTRGSENGRYELHGTHWKIMDDFKRGETLVLYIRDDEDEGRYFYVRPTRTFDDGRFHHVKPTP